MESNGYGIVKELYVSGRIHHLFDFSLGIIILDDIICQVIVIYKHIFIPYMLYIYKYYI